MAGKAQLIVRGLDPAIVAALRIRAAQSGRSVEAEHRDILNSAVRPSRRRPSFKEWLEKMPDVGTDRDFARSRSVEFGVLLPTRETVMSGRPETAPLLAMAERAEAAGFDAVWIGDSLIARPRHEPLTLLAAVAARTRRVRLGTAVLLPALRNPFVLAHIVGTLDRVAEGRVILGVGIAADSPPIRKEFAAAGGSIIVCVVEFGLISPRSVGCCPSCEPTSCVWPSWSRFPGSRSGCRA